jgi:hypothetical protein
VQRIKIFVEFYIINFAGTEHLNLTIGFTSSGTVKKIF